MSVVFPDKDEKHKDWKFKQNPGVRSISVEIYFPASAPVGVWQLTVIVIEKSGAVQQTIQIPNRIVVLFNPFSKEDIQVYYENEKELDEYIMNERGLFGVYNWYEKKKRSWLFSQFKQGILDAVLFILGRADLNSVQRGDAVRIVRELSYLLNDDGEKDRGVLRGKWTPPKKFETAFLYMEINADEVHWKNGQFDSAYTNTIGLVVVTKGVGNYDLLDITDTFKFEEGSREERESYIKATKALKINATSLHYRPTARSVHRFTVKPTIEMPQVSKLGSTVPIVVVVKNPSNKKNVVSVGLKVTSTYYSATDGSVILKARKDNVEVPSGGVNKVIFQVKPEQYLEKLKDFFTNRVEAVVTNANGFVEYTDKHLAFATPVIKVDCPEEAKVGEPFLVYAEFVNPLNMVLADCYFNVEGQRIGRQKVIVKPIAAHGKGFMKVKLKADYPMYETIAVSFSSKLIRGINAVANIHIIGKMSSKQNENKAPQ
ncbi:protein-glutamine gamma-glutamyltransferase 5-like protein [Leptotrombidium deliense]|uniref:Protein-glutamine gamma-glutamyltransferase 5-like protein n=1 Tax=Leptotrombidium deliense TaxID=299467 RepID=A0A443SEY1_9ACAR|nr:protein-glutamine gamma-glutamyltransferase 5-like protein [Leptotrombidium deliense]